jgi:hypothetical protein
MLLIGAQAAELLFHSALAAESRDMSKTYEGK